MPAQEEEIKAAEEEGVEIIYLVSPIRFIGSNGQVEKVECQRMTLGEFDSTGRRRPLPIKGEYFQMDIDQVIIAIGQVPDVSFMNGNGDVRISKRGVIEIKEGTEAKVSESMIFAGGDAVTGPATVIEAIAWGKRAAEEIDHKIRLFNNEPPYTIPELEKIETPIIIDEEIKEIPRQRMPELPVNARVKGFVEVETGFNSEMAETEACRCLRCDISEKEGMEILGT